MQTIKFFFLSIIIIISSLHAHDDAHEDRHGHGKDKTAGCIIYGTVLDSITNKPIEYASISVEGRMAAFSYC